MHKFLCQQINQIFHHSSAPGEPRKVKFDALNSTTILVQWRPPAESEVIGLVRGYQIHYTAVNESDDQVTAPAVHNVTDGARTEAMITGLTPNAMYQMQIAAYTMQGLGDFTKPKRIRTKGAGLYMLYVIPYLNLIRYLNYSLKSCAFVYCIAMMCDIMLG